MTEISVQHFIFIKCYAEQLIVAINKYMTLICVGCQNNTSEHTCLSHNYFIYFNIAKYFISTFDLYYNVNIKLVKHNLAEMTYCEIVKLYEKVDDWIPIIQAVISIIDL